MQLRAQGIKVPRPARRYSGPLFGDGSTARLSTKSWDDSTRHGFRVFNYKRQSY